MITNKTALEIIDEAALDNCDKYYLISHLTDEDIKRMQETKSFSFIFSHINFDYTKDFNFFMTIASVFDKIIKTGGTESDNKSANN